jgi:hypothetical protein
MITVFHDRRLKERIEPILPIDQMFRKVGVIRFYQHNWLLIILLILHTTAVLLRTMEIAELILISKALQNSLGHVSTQLHYTPIVEGPG